MHSTNLVAVKMYKENSEKSLEFDGDLLSPSGSSECGALLRSKFGPFPLLYIAAHVFLCVKAAVEFVSVFRTGH